MTGEKSPTSNSREKTHYDRAYFDWQRELGEFGAWADLPKFSSFIDAADTVVDFGCGGGYILAAANCARRIGIEIGEEAAAEARTRLDQVYRTAGDVPSEIANIVISNHALEHARHPLKELTELRRILKPGGKIVIAVPCESVAQRYVAGDINQHLYSWSPMCLGNLLSAAGFEVQSSTAYLHKWPPRVSWPLLRHAGRHAFDLAARVRGRLDRRVSQALAVAVKI